MTTPKKLSNTRPIFKSAILFLYLLGLSSQYNKSMCSLTHLVLPNAEPVVSSEEFSSISLLKTTLKSSVSNAEVSFMIRFKLTDPNSISKKFINLLEMALKRPKQKVLHLLKMRINQEAQKISIDFLDEKNHFRNLEITTDLVETGKWYILAMGLDFMKGNGGIYLVKDDMGHFKAHGKYVFVGTHPQLGTVLPDSSLGNLWFLIGFGLLYL
jgi:hypothetical protein